MTKQKTKKPLLKNKEAIIKESKKIGIGMLLILILISILVTI